MAAGEWCEKERNGRPKTVRNSEKVSVSQERVSGFPEKGADLRGSPGTSGEVQGTSGEVWETSGELLVAGRFHSERTSGEVAEKLPGKFGELPGKSGDFPEARGSLTLSLRLAKFVSKKQAPQQCENESKSSKKRSKTGEKVRNNRVRFVDRFLTIFQWPCSRGHSGFSYFEVPSQSKNRYLMLCAFFKSTIRTEIITGRIFCFGQLIKIM